jgi:hypothetical protein
MKKQSVHWKESYECLRVANRIIINRRTKSDPFLEIEKSELIRMWNLS